MNKIQETGVTGKAAGAVEADTSGLTAQSFLLPGGDSLSLVSVLVLAGESLAKASEILSTGSKFPVPLGITADHILRWAGILLEQKVRVSVSEFIEAGRGWTRVPSTRPVNGKHPPKATTEQSGGTLPEGIPLYKRVLQHIGRYSTKRTNLCELAQKSFGATLSEIPTDKLQMLLDDCESTEDVTVYLDLIYTENHPEAYLPA